MYGSGNRRRRHEDDSSDDSNGANSPKRFHVNGIPPDSPASPTPSTIDEEVGAAQECINIPLTRVPEVLGVQESEGSESRSSQEASSSTSFMPSETLQEQSTAAPVTASEFTGNRRVDVVNVVRTFESNNEIKQPLEETERAGSVQIASERELDDDDDRDLDLK